MFDFIIGEMIILFIISFVVICLITRKQILNSCKLEKVSMCIYIIILELVWIFLFSVSILLFKYSTLKIFIFGVLSLLIILILNEIFENISFRYFYMNNIYRISLIKSIEILILRIYPMFIRIKRGCLRILKNLVQLFPVIIIEIFFIYVFSAFLPIQDKQWDIFELILTTVVITAYVNIYNSEKERKNNLKF